MLDISGLDVLSTGY